MSKKIDAFTELAAQPAVGDLFLLELASSGQYRKIKWSNLVADGSITTAKLASSIQVADKEVSPYKASAHLLADQAVSAATWTKATLNTELFDTGSNFDNVTNYRFVAPIAGFYLFFGGVGLSVSGTSAGYMESALYVNGVARTYSDRLAFSGSSASIARGKVSGLVQLAANDYLEMYGFITDSGRSFAAGKELTYLQVMLWSKT